MGGEEYRLKRRSAFLAAALASLAPAAAQPDLARARTAADCERLSALRIPAITITLADSIEPGTFGSPDGEVLAVPAFCRVHGEARPTSDSLIHFEVWLPAGGWNGRYYRLSAHLYVGPADIDTVLDVVRSLATKGAN